MPVWPIVLGGIGVVAVGVGSYFGLKAVSNASDARDLCPNGQCVESRGKTLMDDARDQATLSNVAFGVGIAAVASSVVLYLTTPSGDSKSSVGLVPRIDARGAGLGLEGRL